jgi:O-antigen/teichoic acid export membrane protein
MAERVFRMLVALFVGIYVARYLGPEQFGLLNYATSFVGLFLAIALLGLDAVVVRELVKMPREDKVLLGSAFILKIVGALIMWAAIVCVIPFTSNDAETNALVAIIAFAALFQAFNVIDFHYQANVQSKYVVHSQLVQLVFSSLLKVLFVLISAPLVWFAWIFVFDAIVLALSLSMIYLKKEGSMLHWQWDSLVATRLLKYSWPLVPASLMIAVYLKIDQVMIKEMLGPEQVGYYAAAVKLSEAWYFIPVAITTSLFPAIVNAKQASEKVYTDRMQKLYDLMVWMALVIAVPATFLSEWVINTLYGPTFIASATVLSLHIWAGIFVFLGVASSRWYLTENLQKLFFYRSLTGVVINIGLNLLLIPRLGINGAAIATIISQVFSAWLFDLVNRRTQPVFWQKTHSLFPFLRLIRI